MTAQFARAPYRGRSGGSTPHEPHAALLIDFDNVTMGIRSDLTKELKNLLNSDIIKGKVAVQRAYADWRRYPQYIVPLAESSVDLIFAPAYGSAKKNATDIRLAIDAVELVFTRPEIGTIILLSGDSDFSSLVLKLKEYGKYVIGVGIRESASDLLVQNCDEYYSYSALTGLTRAGDESAVISEDPWELVEMGLRQMIENDDVMRSDRLKQVLLEMDPNFDEKALGFQKFNKFLQEAANRGIISLRKLENGQYEVGPPAGEGETPESSARDGREAREARDRGRRGRRGRGRREEEREDREAPVREPAAAAPSPVQAPESEPAAAPRGRAAETPAAAGPAAAAPARQPEPSGAAAEPAAKPPSAPKPQAEQPRPERAEPSAKAAEPVTEAAGVAAEPAAEPREPEAPAAVGDLRSAYDLLRRATTDLVRRAGGVARDSDVKRRMIELQPGWDETPLGFSKFSRFLRQAHDAQVVTLRRGESGNYDVVPGDADVPSTEAEREPGRRDRDRGRGRGRDRQREEPAAAASETARPRAAEPAAEPARATQATTPAAPAAPAAAPAAPAAVPAAPAAAAATAPATPAPQPAGFGFIRRGSRGRPAASGPPPLLEGQTAAVQRTAGQAAAAPAAPAAVPEAAAEPATPEASTEAAQAPAKKAPRKRGRGRGAAKEAAASPTAQLEFDGGAAASPAGKSTGAPAGEAAAGRKQPAKQAAKQAAKKTPRKAARGERIDAAALGLPRQAGEIARYIATTYKGVGPKSVEALLERFGPGRIFDALQNRPDEVRDVMGAGRGDRLLEAWAADLSARRAAADGDGSAAPAEAAAATGEPASTGGSRRGGRRGRRGRAAAK